jgi:hypothetical protein
MNERPAPHLFSFSPALGTLHTKLYGCRCNILDVVIVFELPDCFQVLLIHTTLDHVFDALLDIR